MSGMSIAAFAGGLVTVWQLVAKRRLRRRLAAQPQVRAAEFGRRYYADARTAEIASFVAVALEDAAEQELTGLAPEDRIVADLRIDDIDSLAAAR